MRVESTIRNQCQLTLVGSLILKAAEKKPSHPISSCFNPNVTPQPSPLTWKLCPFGAAISWLYKAESGTERDWGQKKFGAESLTTSTMTTTVSRSSPAFWRGQPQKIWEPYCQLHTAEEQKSRPLTGLLVEAKNIYKQLATLTDNKETARGALVFLVAKKKKRKKKSC